jgi:GH25 family lysozyme M1 (1,4-beta-N-acetylmuramidase)
MPVMFRAGQQPGAAPRMAPALTTAPSVLLADISEFQPDIADAAYLAWSKAIIIRAMYGDAHDDHAWYGGARRAALHAGGARFVGIYIYLVAGQNGAAQAQAFHKLVGAIQPGEVFVADFEEGSKTVLAAWYNEMLALYGKAITPYLWTYSGLYFGQAQGVLPVQWLAAYGMAEPSSRHTLWQFTDAYAVPGVGTCDASVFHGTIDQLAALACQPRIAKGTSMKITTPPPGDYKDGTGGIFIGLGPQGQVLYTTATSDGKTWTAPIGQ